LLTQAVDVLHRLCVQPLIAVYDSATVVDRCYALCSLCQKETARLERGAAARSGMYKFTKLPLRSYANGLWTRVCPPELSGLTFLEEQCVARVRAMQCMFKLELGPTGQYAFRSNVCIFPQDPSPLVRICWSV
jgi:hypothetical protein